MAGTTPIFIVLTGGYGNIGDAVIRRQALRWVRGTGTIHAYVGNGPDHWREQLGLVAEDVVYRAGDAAKWIGKLLITPGRPVLVFEPGEVLLTNRQLPKELVFLLLTAVTRLRRGVVVRNPRAVREPAKAPTAVHRLASRLSQVALWRDRESLDIIRVGTPVPDIAFSEPLRNGTPLSERSTLLVSLRGPRPYPPTSWFQGVTAYAEEAGLSIVTISQVREDEERSEELAAELGGTHVPWGDRTDIEQEAVVRSTFSSANFVLTDRLHVAILGILSGAVPAEIVPAPSGKIDRHFRQIGIESVSLDASKATPTEMVEFMRERSSLRANSERLLIAARSTLDAERESIRNRLTALAPQDRDADRSRKVRV